MIRGRKWREIKKRNKKLQKNKREERRVEKS